MYFNAIQKIGEQALQSSTSQILGEARPFPYRSADLRGLGDTPHSSTSPHLFVWSRLCLLAPPLRLRACLAPHSRVPERVPFTAWLFQEVLPKDMGLAAQGPSAQTLLLEPMPLLTPPRRSSPG